MNLRDPKTQIVAIVVVLFLGTYYFWFAKIYSPFQAEIAAKARALSAETWKRYTRMGDLAS